MFERVSPQSGQLQLAVWNKASKGVGPFLHSIDLLGKCRPELRAACLTAPETTNVFEDSGNTSELLRRGVASLIVPLGSATSLYDGTFLRVFNPSVLEALEARRCRIFIDFSNEGMLDADVKQLTRLIGDAGIRYRHGVVLICQNRCLDSQHLAFRHFTYDYFPVMAVMALQKHMISQASVAIHPDDDIGGRTGLLCMNATPRTNRIISLLALIHAGAINLDNFNPHGFPCLPWVSFPGLHYPKGSTSVDSVLYFLRTHDLEYLEPFFHRLIEIGSLKVDHFLESGDSLWDRVDLEPYRRTILSCVTETTTCPGLERLTEKTLKPLLLGHPCIVFGPRHSMRLAEDLGFNIFRDVIDHDYDDLAEEGDRITAAAKAAADFIHSVRTRRFTARHLARQSIANREWGKSDFLRHYWQRFVSPILADISRHPNGSQY